MGLFAFVKGLFYKPTKVDIDAILLDLVTGIDHLRPKVAREYEYMTPYSLVKSDDRLKNIREYYRYVSHGAGSHGDLKDRFHKALKIKEELKRLKIHLDTVDDLRMLHKQQRSKSDTYNDCLKFFRENPESVDIRKALAANKYSLKWLKAEYDQGALVFQDGDGNSFQSDSVVAILLDLPLWAANMLLLKGSRHHDGDIPLFKKGTFRDPVTNAMMIETLTSLSRSVSPEKLVNPDPVLPRKIPKDYPPRPRGYSSSIHSTTFHGGSRSSSSSHTDHDNTAMNMLMVHSLMADHTPSSSSSSGCDSSSSYSSDSGSSCSGGDWG